MSQTAFIDYLVERKNDRAMLASLRRCIGKTQGDVRSYPYIVRFLPKEKYKSASYFLLAGLFGLHPEHTSKQYWTIGRAFRLLTKTDSRDKRFKTLLDAEGKQFAYHLQQAVSLLKSKDLIKINYYQLFKDIQGWTHSEKYVQLQWAKDFWAE